jgi:hypothetical protein
MMMMMMMVMMIKDDARYVEKNKNKKSCVLEK